MQKSGRRVILAPGPFCKNSSDNGKPGLGLIWVNLKLYLVPVGLLWKQCNKFITPNQYN